MASRLARRHGLRLYSADTRTWQHVDTLTALGSETARRWNATTPDALERFFDLSGGVTTHAERVALIRESNLAIANQVRAFYARGDTQGDPERVTRRFACECGHPSCPDFFEAPVAVIR